MTIQAPTDQVPGADAGRRRHRGDRERAPRHARRALCGRRLRRRMAGLRATRSDRRRMARAGRQCARAQRVLRARLRACGGAGVRARSRRRPGLVDERAAPAARIFSGAGRDTALRLQIAGAARLDPCLCPAWGAAGRARSRRSGHCRMAGASRRGRGAARRAAAAVPSRRRSVRRDPGDNPAAHADAERRLSIATNGRCWRRAASARVMSSLR